MEMFHYDFMIKAFLAAGLISIIAPVLGLYLILRRQSLVADTLSHVSLSGVALGLILGLNPTLTTMVFIAIMALVLDYLRYIYKSYSELSMAFVMSGGMALSFILLSINQSASATVNQFLFGSIVTVSNQQLLFLLVLTVIIIALYTIFKKPMYVLTFDEETAFVQGLPTRLMSQVFMVLTGLAIALMMPTVGVLLVSAILIFPAAIAMRLVTGFTKVILLGISIALIGMFSGLTASYYYDTPPGATIVMIYILIFSLSLIIQKIKAKI
ncbi:MAG: metal ABC transporter permease [Atopococcus tabaci]|uniref:Metal ABC transporter permease n=1 Tax=Atopococcus tabaci TaxID=269774 RepID=A0AA43UBZ8_9LACT|nr:metal ABC transporter permease [Atopococcus tabaci]